MVYSLSLIQSLLHYQLPTLTQFEATLTAMLSHLEASTAKGVPDSSLWHQYFAIALLSWSPSKYRSILVDLLLARLTLIDRRPVSSKPVQAPPLRRARTRLFADMLSALLSHPAARTIELLNVLHLLHELVRLLDTTPDEMALSEAIAALGCHTYYPQQPGDMSAELLALPLRPHRLATLATLLSRAPSTATVTLSSWIPALCDVTTTDQATEHQLGQAVEALLKRNGLHVLIPDFSRFLQALTFFTHRTRSPKLLLPLLSLRLPAVLFIILPMLRELSEEREEVLAEVSKTWSLPSFVDYDDWESWIFEVCKSTEVQTVTGFSEKHLLTHFEKRRWTPELALRMGSFPTLPPFPMKLISISYLINTASGVSEQTPNKRTSKRFSSIRSPPSTSPTTIMNQNNSVSSLRSTLVVPSGGRRTRSEAGGNSLRRKTVLGNATATSHFQLTRLTEFGTSGGIKNDTPLLLRFVFFFSYLSSFLFFREGKRVMIE